MKNPLVPLSSVLESLFKKKFTEIYFLSKLHQNWNQVAGEEIARFAYPVQFKNRELILSLPDSTHLQEMHFAKETLRQKIHRQFPNSRIEKIILKVSDSPTKR